MEVALHPRQQEVFVDPARFKVVAAGRRFGKTYLAATTLFVAGAMDSKVRSDGSVVDLSLEKVYYVCPTFTQGKAVIWPLLKQLGGDLIAQSYEKEAIVRLINGREIAVKGADNPDSLRGTGLSHVVLDEYAFMKPEVWEYIIYPQLMTSEGTALFIGTPEGKNHFYELWTMAHRPENADEWQAFLFHTQDNPYISTKEFDRLVANMSEQAYRQEILASFETGAGTVMTADMFKVLENAPYPGDVYITADLAGFHSSRGGKHVAKLDEHAIAVVLNHSGGWHILDIIHGQWDVRETALRLVKAYRDHRPIRFGIEKGMAKNAVMPYLKDEMARLGLHFNVEELSHGNQRKTDRIAWALQGRAEKGRITLAPGEWNKDFIGQACDFPSPIAHDDLIDAVAYVDQIAEPWFDGPAYEDTWQPLDATAGY